jgi:hypothetical protein
MASGVGEFRRGVHLVEELGQRIDV